MAEEASREPICELCGTAEFLAIDVYRPPVRAIRGRPAGQGREVEQVVSEPAVVFFHCTRCGTEGGCSVPDSFRPPS